MKKKRLKQLVSLCVVLTLIISMIPVSGSGVYAEDRGISNETIECTGSGTEEDPYNIPSEVITLNQSIKGAEENGINRVYYSYTCQEDCSIYVNIEDKRVFALLYANGEKIAEFRDSDKDRYEIKKGTNILIQMQNETENMSSFSIEIRNKYSAKNYTEAIRVTSENYKELDLTRDYIGYYAIYNKEQLKNFQKIVKAANHSRVNGVLCEDIIYNKHVLDENGELKEGRFDVWFPIGHATAVMTGSYYGNFDGRGHTISGLYFKNSQASLNMFVGLFGRIVDSTVKNVNVVDSYFECKETVGGIVACLCSSSVYNCYSAATVVANSKTDNNCVGGIVGATTGVCEIEQCINAGSVRGVQNQIGGILGYLNNSSILNCCNVGSVSGSFEVGGIVGAAVKNGTVKNCFSKGTVTGTNTTGAVSGEYLGKNGFICENNYYLAGSSNKTNSYGTSKTEEQCASGEVAYLLNESKNMGVWGLEKTVDDCPIPNGAGICYDEVQNTYYNHLHKWNYTLSEDKSTITAVCTAQNCPDTAGGSITIQAPKELAADEEGKEAILSKEQLDASIEVGEIAYSTDDGMPPTKPGTYTAGITLGDVTASVEYTITRSAAIVTDKDKTRVGCYESFADALTAASQNEGSTLKLIEDITLEKRQNLEAGKFTIDLNGKKITCLATTGLYLKNKNVEVTICDTATGGKIESEVLHANVVYVSEGTINLYSGKLIYNGLGYSTNTVCVNNGTFNMYGGEVCNLENYAFYNMSGAVNIYDGMIQSVRTNVYNSEGRVTIKGGTFVRNADYNIYNRSGSVKVSGGEFKNSLKVSGCKLNDILEEACYYRDADGKILMVEADAKEIDSYVKITKGADLETEAQVTLEQTEYEYDGSAKEPKVTVKVADKELVENTDYSVLYTDNVNKGTATVTITGTGNYSGTVTKEFTINARAVEIIWNAEKFYYTGNQVALKAYYEDVKGENVELVCDDIATETGSYTATVQITDSNYIARTGTDSHSYQISYLPISEPAYSIEDGRFYNSEKDIYWFQSKDTVTIKADDGYTVSKELNGTYTVSVTFSESENKEIYLKNSKGEMTDKISLEAFISYDDTAPTAQYRIGTDAFKKFVNTFSVGMFGKDYKTVELTYGDEKSGVETVQYYISKNELSQTELKAVAWEAYEKPLSLNTIGTYVIYVRAVDKAGNEAIFNSEGIVIFEDSTKNAEVEYTRTTKKDVLASISFNQNTIKEVTCGTKVLREGTDYTVVDTGILLREQFLETLAASDTAYTIKVSYFAQGVEWGKDSYGIAPADTTIFVLVKLQDGSVTNIGNVSKVYDGQAVSKAAYDSLSTGKVTYEYKEKGTQDSAYTTDAPQNAGTYVVRITVAADSNYKQSIGTAEFTIEKAKLTVKADEKAKIYGESDPKLTWQVTKGTLITGDELKGISGLRTKGNDVSQYDITLSQTEGANPNYDITLEGATFTINKKTIGIKWENTTLSYDGSEKLPIAKATGTVYDDKLTLTVSGAQTEISQNGQNYTAEVTGIIGEKAANYQLPEFCTTEFIIQKGVQAKPTGLVGEPEDIDGRENGIISGVNNTMEYRKDDEVLYTAIEGTQLTALADGTYYIRYKEKEKYFPSEETILVLKGDSKLTINLPEKQTGYTLVADKTALSWKESAVLTFTLEEGYSKTENFVVKVDGNPVEWDGNTFVIADVQQNVTVTVEGVEDITAPKAELTVGTNKWDTFFEKISFGLFFKNKQEAVIRVADADKGSAIDKISYYLAASQMTEEEVKLLADDKWTEYKGAFYINPQEEYIIYVRAADKAGNVAYISSEYGIIVDTIAPVISGIKDGGAYSQNVTFSVSDTYLDTVMVDGKEVTLTDGSYTMDVDGQKHSIFATDKAGNSTGVTIKMVTIEAVEDVIEDITIDNVKSTDRDVIQKTLDTVNSLLEKENEFTDAQKEQLNNIKSNAESLLNKINSVTSEITGITGKLKDILENSVTIEHKSDLEKGKTELEQGLENYKENLTEEETEAIRAWIERIEKALERLKKGDVDGNEKVDLQDAELALKAALKIITLDEQGILAADVDNEAGITLKDVQLILKYALRIIPSFD